MAKFDFTNPKRTVVELSAKGKSFFFYGDNRTGKTANAVRFPKPFAIAFEYGLNAVAGLAHVVPEKWADTKGIVKEFKRPEVKEMFDTIIIDTADKMGEMLIKYICSIHGVDSIGEANNGFGAYGDIGKYLGEFLDPLLKMGYTVIIIGHDTTKQFIDEDGSKYDRVVPRGDKRIIEAISDAVDVIGYCKSNGFDPESGEEILSTIYFKDGKYFKAGSRWQHIQKSAHPFNPKNVVKALVSAIKKQQSVDEEDGADTKDTYVEKKKDESPVMAVSFEEVKEKIKELMKETKAKTGNFKLATQLVESKLGEGKKVSECTHRHQEILEEIVEVFEERLKEL